MSENDRELKKQKTIKKLHILNTKAEYVISRLRKDVDRAVNEISENVCMYYIPLHFFRRHFVYVYAFSILFENN